MIATANGNRTSRHAPGPSRQRYTRPSTSIRNATMPELRTLYPSAYTQLSLNF